MPRAAVLVACAVAATAAIVGGGVLALGTSDTPAPTASTDAAKAYLGDPTASDAPHYLEVWAKYLRGLDPVHRPLITKELVDYWCLYGTPDDLLEKTQLMREAGCDMVSVFLSNPFTAERDIADIGASILART